MEQQPLTPTEFSSAVTAITSAFGDPTRREIYLFIHENPEGVTSAQIAQKFSLHANVARHHLEKLSGGGYLLVERIKPTEGAGRPSKKYKPTNVNVLPEMPIRHDDVLVTLLNRALKEIPLSLAEELAEEVGYDYGKAMAKSMSDIGQAQHSFRSALHLAADALTAHGFATHAERHNNGLRLVSQHCPFGDAAIQNPVICAVDKGMVRGILNELHGDIQSNLDESVPMGNDQCIASISSTQK